MEEAEMEEPGMAREVKLELPASPIAHVANPSPAMKEESREGSSPRPLAVPAIVKRQVPRPPSPPATTSAHFQARAVARSNVHPPPLDP